MDSSSAKMYKYSTQAGNTSLGAIVPNHKSDSCLQDDGDN